MPTAYKTTRTYYEDGFGTVTDVLVVGDTKEAVSDLAAAIETDVFFFEETAEDLDTKAGVFSPAELRFSLLGAAILTASDLSAYEFVLAARNSGTKRFCARFINPASPVVLADYAFFGVVTPKMSAKDLRWEGAEYATAIAPLREWSCTATTYDAAELLNKDLPTLIEAIEADTAWLAANVLDRLGYFRRLAGTPDFDPAGHREVRFASLVDLGALLQRLLNAAAVGTGITITLLESPTDLFAWPAIFQPFQPLPSGPKLRYCLNVAHTAWPIPHGVWSGAGRLLRIGGASTGAMFVSWGLLKPESESTDFSWLKYKTLSELIYALAWNFALYPVFEFTSPTAANMSFRRRSDVESTEVFLRDALDANIDLAPVAPEKNEPIVGNAMFLCREGEHGYFFDGGLGQDFEPAKVQEGDQLPLTVSVTWCMLKDRGSDAGYHFDETGFSALIPHNAVWYDSPTARAYLADPANGSDHWQEYNREGCHTAIYLKATGPSDATGEVGVEGLDTWRPVAAIAVQYGGGYPFTGVKTYRGLADYVNDVLKRDEIEYEQQYEITVGGLCSFRATVGGASDWRNLKLGRYFTLDGLRYVAVSITRGRTETKLTLHRASRFNEFQDPSGATIDDDPPADVRGSNLPVQSQVRRSLFMQQYDVGEEIPQFAAVVLIEGLAYKARPIAAHYGLFQGIAMTASNLTSGVRSITVQKNGRINIGTTIALSAENDRVFLSNGSVNISRTAPPATSGTYVFEVGLMESSSVLFIRPGCNFVIE
ncbi:MAG: hypothetical protein EKK55_24880 [Rhodocyclaceae bacterium]|nr:MAG: hypothetical protein EKK55_24880 [Rhodocyclaceae bacterium]